MVTCWKIIKVETMPCSVRMMWPAMIILCVPDLLHIIFSLSSSFGCQARSSYFCQCLVLYLEKGTGMPWGVGKDYLPSAPWFGKLENTSAHALQYIVLFNELLSLHFLFFFFLDYLETVTQSSREELKKCSWNYGDIFVKKLDILSLGWRYSFFFFSPDSTISVIPKLFFLWRQLYK